MLKVSSFIVRIQMPNFTANKQIKMKSLKVGSRHISKRSLLLRQLFLSDCSSQFINFKAYCLPFLLQVSLLLSFRPKCLLKPKHQSYTLLFPHILSPFLHNDQRQCFHQELQSSFFFFFCVSCIKSNFTL